MITWEDCRGNVMGVGDRIIFTTSSEGVSPLEFGEIVKFTAKSFYVKPLNPDWTPKQKKAGYWQGTGEFYTQNQWEIQRGMSPREKTEFIQTGWEDLPPQLVPYTGAYRFLIVK